MSIVFTALTQLHLPILLKWLELPHVKKWWDSNVIYTLNSIQEKFGKHVHGKPISETKNKLIYAYIISINDQSVGYIQAFNAHSFANENGLNLAYMPEATCGIDLFIGEKGFLHKSFGVSILNEFSKQILQKHFDVCIVDPDSRNLIAIKAFKKAGFIVMPTLQTKKTIVMIKKLGVKPF